MYQRENKVKNDLNFSWIIENDLAASAIPNSISKLKWLIKENDINIIVSLNESKLTKYVKNFKEIKSKLNFKHYQISTMDGTGFFPAQFMKLNKIYLKAKAEEKSMLVHCTGGFGRTSTALTSIWMFKNKMPLDPAINKLKVIRTQFMVTSIQKESLRVWEEYLRKMKIF